MRRGSWLTVLTVLVGLTAGRQTPPVEWMSGEVGRRAAGEPPPLLPPRDPDAEIVRPITDPRPALDGNFQVPRGHRLAGVFRNDKPRLPADYVRFLRRQGLTPEQIEHGAGLQGTRRVRAPPPAAQPSASPAPGRIPLPGGLTLHLEPVEPEPEPEPERRPADLYPALQDVPAPSIDHLRPAGAAHINEVGVTTSGGKTSLRDLSELRAGHPSLEELRRHHRRIKQRLDDEWSRQLQRHEEAARGRPGPLAAPQGHQARRLPGRRVSYSKRTTHRSSYTTRGGRSALRPRQQRRKRQHLTARRRRQWLPDC